MALWPDDDRCYSTRYDHDYGYDYAPDMDQTYAHEYGEHELIEYDNSCAYYTDDSFATSSYYFHNYSEPKMLQYDQYNSYNYYEIPSETCYSQPKFLQYEPPPSDRGYFRTETKFTLSYSTVEFNEPEFEEYDSTPYDGGYDLVATYGKPLPPSDATCYPPTRPQPDSSPPEFFSFSSIPSPYGKDNDNDHPATKPPAQIVQDNELPNKPADKVKDSGVMILVDDPPPPFPPPQQPHEDEVKLEIERLPQDHPELSYGAGLEAIDLCESVFGYWPCLAKEARKCGACDQEMRPEAWDQRAVDYLFGSPVVYDYQHQSGSWMW